MTWIKDWQQDFGANRPAAEIIVDAMARYTLHLKSQGASPRRLSEVYDDLNSAGFLVMMYDAPKGKNAERILSRFDGPLGSLSSSGSSLFHPVPLRDTKGTWRGLVGSCNNLACCVRKKGNRRVSGSLPAMLLQPWYL